MYSWCSVKSFFKYKPSVAYCPVPVPLEVAVLRAAHPLREHPYPARRRPLKQLPALLTFKKRQLQQHGHLAALADTLKSLFDKALSLEIRRIGNYVAVPSLRTREKVHCQSCLLCRSSAPRNRAFPALLICGPVLRTAPISCGQNSQSQATPLPPSGLSHTSPPADASPSCGCSLPTARIRICHSCASGICASY